MPGSFPMAGAGGCRRPGEADRSTQLLDQRRRSHLGPDLGPGLAAGPETAAGDGMGWMMPGGGAGRGQDRERSRLAWTGETTISGLRAARLFRPVIGG